MRNMYKYIIEPIDDETSLISDESDTFVTKVSNKDVETVSNYLWSIDDQGYYTMQGQTKIYLGQLILRATPESIIIYVDSNPFNDNTRHNMQIYSTGDDMVIQVDGYDVIVDRQTYYSMDLYNINLRIYQGYVVYVKDRKRHFLHKEVMGFQPDNVRYRFRNRNRLDCRRMNIRVERFK